ncbi:MAG TPA: Appr-1-p processing protein [Myxococcota bacterium]|nr:Appr-1-p processing protein [Myxococcota bacterium]
MIRYVSGDLLTIDANFIVQGVAEGNQEGLGTGLALKISRKWPDVQAAFKRHARSGRFKGGDLFVVDRTDDRPGVIYLATQPDMYHATIPYLRRALKRLALWVRKTAPGSIAMPKVGAGLGKLSWEGDVKPLLEEYLTDLPSEIIVLEDFKLTYEA